MENQNSMASMSTERNYNLEFCEGLLKHPKLKEGKELRYFDLLVVAESIVGEELWRIEEAMLEIVEAYEVRQLSEDEWKNLNQLMEDSKKKHTKEILAIVERVVRAFNPSANEERIQTVIQNAIKTSNIEVQEPKEEMPNIKTQNTIKNEDVVKEDLELEEQLKGADLLQNWVKTL